MHRHGLRHPSIVNDVVDLLATFLSWRARVSMGSSHVGDSYKRML